MIEPYSKTMKPSQYLKAIIAFALATVGELVSVGFLHGTAAQIVGAVTVGAVTIGVYQTPNRP